MVSSQKQKKKEGKISWNNEWFCRCERVNEQYADQQKTVITDHSQY